MPKDLKRYGQAGATSVVARQPARMDGFVNIGPALVCSQVTRLFGRPYPIQFRAQGALDAWAHALGNTGLWALWRAPRTLCWQIREEVLRQLECAFPSFSVRRWTAKRKSALVLEIIQGKTTVAEASRAHDLSPSEVESWVEDGKRGMENALRANPLDVREQYEKQIRELQEAYGEDMLELRVRKKLQSLLGEDEK